MPDFSPSGLEDFIQTEKAQTNKHGKEIIDRIEGMLQRTIVAELNQEFGSDESQWWLVGVPKNVRLKVAARFEEEGGKRGGKEHYFDLIDYRTIVQANWNLFERILSEPGKGSKDKRTQWMVDVNERRKVVAHASSAVMLTVDEVNELRRFEEMLQMREKNALADVETQNEEDDGTDSIAEG